MTLASVWKNICKSFPILSDKIGYPGEIRGIFVRKLMFNALALTAPQGFPSRGRLWGALLIGAIN